MQKLCRIFIIFVIFTGAFGIDLDFIESKPSGIVRDFYIYQYLQGDVSKDEALKLYTLIDNKSYKIISLLKTKLPITAFPKDMQCKAKGLEELIKADDECFNMGFRLDYAKKIDDKNLKRLNNSDTIRQVKILQSKNPLDSILKGDEKDFISIYNGISAKDSVFNTTSKNLKYLSNKNYNMVLYNLVVTKKFPKFSKALLNVEISNVNDWSFYALGLNELESGSKKKALKYFGEVAKNTKVKILRDKALFWQYKLSSDEAYLKELANSPHFNLYSLYAAKSLNVAPKYQLVFEGDEIFKYIKDNKTPFNIKNPFEWQVISSNIIDVKDKEALVNIAKLFYYKDTMPHLIFILNRYFNFSKSFFVMPYREDLEFKDISLVYAVAKQESGFIPSVISRSYALGMMQIMPFNVEGFAKAQKLSNITMESMFDPKISLQFGAYYLEHLKKEFKHPLFVSYAYNGGPTFIRNFLKNPKVFSKKNKFDPWLSMEFIPYEESRFYGINVMANYIIYNEINGNILNVEEFLKESLRG